MIKGGFQGLDISGVDLTAQSPTLPGGYAACQAAEGKTVLVLTAAGAVQCSVKKVSTNYVLAGITGDGKILSITIGSTDGISVSENVPGEVGGNHYLDAVVSILDNTDLSKFTVPADGYAKCTISANTTLTGSLKIVTNCTTNPGGEINSNTNLISIPSGTAGEVINTVFVKKGMKLWCIHSDDAGINVGYYKIL